MKNLKSKHLYLSALLVFVLHFGSVAQEQFVLDRSTSKLTVTGTSTIHNWEVEAEEFNCSAKISMTEASVAEISNVEFSCLSESIKSESKLMDKKTHGALNTDKFPEITFQFNSETNVSFGKESKINGELTIAGKKNPVSVDVLVNEENNQVKVVGELPLKFSDFNIDPPTAMLGTLKTGDDIVVTYEFVFDRTLAEN